MWDNLQGSITADCTAEIPPSSSEELRCFGYSALGILPFRQTPESITARISRYRPRQYHLCLNSRIERLIKPAENWFDFLNMRNNAKETHGESKLHLFFSIFCSLVHRKALSKGKGYHWFFEVLLTAAPGQTTSGNRLRGLQGLKQTGKNKCQPSALALRAVAPLFSPLQMQLGA